ncbi:P-loop containing nucleoside triphosphate hydrolase protein [Apodospora peruviana]|uniref:P-loop containing nucleoside triphosphate hydrolase protein n=1 Tax=Apodospora peruviana TaxID=516989 RepID=A0AAE0ISZ2_9PEZI|nr:P-loop containing nucleoside triphosphate hydrolase protein [Apodospora peruviana]
MADNAVTVRQTAEGARSLVDHHVFFAREQANSWKSLPELPTAAEILMTQKESEGLPSNPVNKPWSSKEAYLAAQYQILRREGVEGLRFSVRSFIDACSKKQEMMDDQYTCVYPEVRVRSYLLSRLGPIVRVEFSTARSIYQINWRQSTRLTPGTIVALSTREDKFKKICKVATVAQRPYIDGLDQGPPLVDLMWADPSDAVFDPNLELIMIESRNGYFEATRHVLVGLQHALQTDTPLDKYLTGTHTTDRAPEFVRENPVMDLSSVAHKSSDVDPARIEALKDYDVLDGPPDVMNITTLDNSQLAALHRMVSTELAIVQGPPGTGKTFTSVEAIKVMIATRRSCSGPPIIVAAQTNHALDQLLTHCLDSGAKIARVGGRTESERIQEHTVFQIRQSYPPRPDRNVESSRRATSDAIGTLVDDIFGDNLLNPEALLKAGIITQAQYDSLHDETMESDALATRLGPFSLWLGDDLIPAEILRHKHHSQSQLDEAAAKLIAEWEFDGDLENIADDEDDLDRIRGTLVELAHVWTGKEPGHLKSWDRLVKRRLAEADDLFTIEPELRGAVYQHLQAKLLESLTPVFTALLARYSDICKRGKASKWCKDIELINNQSIDIVGCTTTGLTKYRGFLAGLHPRSLLIEEAAESREANITSAIYPSIQQLILVGDHQQLAPHCDIRWLGEEPFNLNVSLFQRMVNLNMEFVMLNQQRRMKPELRKILSPFYPDLVDHPVVKSMENRPDVPGMGGRNCWYFDHSWPEDVNAEQSKFNEQEGQMLVNFFAYLVANGVPANQITILTFYNGQRKYLVSRLKRHGSLMGLTFNVCTVDSYQGEENDVILLSLVRSPITGYAVGFLEDQRRAVIAISRARRGFYIFGNLENLLRAHHESLVLWGKIWNGFAEQSCVRRKKGIPLTCKKHGNEIWIRQVDDWGDNAGGCNRPCGEIRPCGHNCTLKCHFTPHERLSCGQPCPKMLDCGHGCEKFCSQPCSCSCEGFRDIKIREEVEAKQLDKIEAEGDMALEEMLLRHMVKPSDLVKAAAGRVKLSLVPDGRHSHILKLGKRPGKKSLPAVRPKPQISQPPDRTDQDSPVHEIASDQMGASDPCTDKLSGQNPCSDDTGFATSTTDTFDGRFDFAVGAHLPDKWSSYTDNVKFHDTKLRGMDRRATATMARKNPRGLVIDDTYKPTNVVQGRRTVGIKSTRQVELVVGAASQMPPDDASRVAVTQSSILPQTESSLVEKTGYQPAQPKVHQDYHEDDLIDLLTGEPTSLEIQETTVIPSPIAMNQTQVTAVETNDPSSKPKTDKEVCEDILITL